MIVYDRGQICSFLLPVCGKQDSYSVLDVCLGKHHPMWLAESLHSSRAPLIFAILLHLLLSESCCVQMTLKRRSLQHAFRSFSFSLQDGNDLTDRS